MTQSRSRQLAHSKEAERAVADATGDARNPSSGQLDRFDVEGPYRGFEVKQSSYAWLCDAWDQAQRAAAMTGKTGRVALVHKGGVGGDRSKTKGRRTIFIVERVEEWIDNNGRTL